MNVDRLLREVERRLAHLPGEERSEVLDAVREEIARERRRFEPETTVERERQRRMEAETLREVLEAINRQARLEETIGEVLKQLAKIVSFDTCSISLLEGDGRFRIFATRGFPDPERLHGIAFRDPLTDHIREQREVVSLANVQEDDRYAKIEGTEEIRSWAGIPLLVEGEVLGLLCVDRHRVEPFEDEDVYRAKAVAFSAAAAIRKARLLEQVRRYAALMERVVAVDHAVFARRPLKEVARTILEGALRLGTYSAGLLVLDESGVPRVAAATGAEDLLEAEGRPAPPELVVESSKRIPADQLGAIALGLGVPLPPGELFVVPMLTPDMCVGALALLDPNGESADDRLMESYASRAATAYLHAAQAR